MTCLCSVEEWCPVPGFEGLYEVSSQGRCRSVDRVVKSRWGTPKPVKGELKTLNAQREGYLSVHLYKNGKMAKRYIHRLVAEVFVPNPLGRPQVNHIDGCKTNNAAGNLEWASGSENCRHAIESGLYRQARGESIGGAKLTEQDVAEIRRMVARGAMHKEAAALFGIGRKAVTKIVNRQRWKHVE